MNRHAPLARQEYEDTYEEALCVLRARYTSVGQPHTNAEGVRVCQVEGFTVDDHTAFLLAWGSARTQEIEQQSAGEHGAARVDDGAESDEEAHLDQDWLSNFLLRWVLAEEYLLLDKTGGCPEAHAVGVVIKRDIPLLLKELVRHRPDLTFRVEA